MSTLAQKLVGQSRYGTLAQALRERILQGEWEPGAAIPSEAFLAQLYGVALGTIRQAVALLVQDGVLQRVHGRGTFVSNGLDGATMMRFFRFQDAARPQEAPISHILSTRIRKATRHEALALGLTDDAQVFQFERLRSLSQQPCLLENIVLPLPMFGPLADLDSSAWGNLLYPMYQARCGVVIAQANDALSFVPLTASQAKRLLLKAGHPCVLVERQALDMRGNCVELRVTRGDAFAFKYTAHVR
jgi:GntR family transcriptional regulator